MQLYERVLKLAENVAGSQTKMANALKLKPRTFSAYLNEDRQDNLWPLLPAILEAYHQVSRNWLYFDEGETLNGEQPAAAASVEPDNWKDKYLGALEDLNKLHGQSDMVRRVLERVIEESEGARKVAEAELAASVNELHKLDVAHHRLRQKYSVLQVKFQTARLALKSLERELEETKRSSPIDSTDGVPGAPTQKKPSVRGASRD